MEGFEINPPGPSKTTSHCETSTGSFWFYRRQIYSRWNLNATAAIRTSLWISAPPASSICWLKFGIRFCLQVSSVAGTPRRLYSRYFPWFYWDLRTETGVRVRVGASASNRFHTSSGVRQSCVLAPPLFCCAIDWIMTDLAGVEVGSLQIWTNADDIVLPVSDYDELVPCLTLIFYWNHSSRCLLEPWVSTSLGQRPKFNSSEYLARNQMFACAVQGQDNESVDRFCYLGSV